MQGLDNKTENITDFIKRCKTRLKILLDKLEWSEEMVKKNFNTNSVASKLTKQPKIVQPPRVSEYPNSCIHPNNLVLDTTKLRELLQDNTVESPHNFQELQANFNREQKLKIYEYVIENTQKLETNLETPVAEGELSLADILAQKKREEKRKKRKFRKTKPTHIEEVRCLVNLQMQALKQFLRKSNENATAGKSSHSRSHRAENYINHNESSKNRAYEKEFKRSSRNPSKERTKTYDKYNTSSNKDLTNVYKRRSRSRTKDLTNAYRIKRSKSPAKGSHYRRDIKRNDRSRSRERNDKHKRRRSRSRSYDRHTNYKHHKLIDYYHYKAGRNRSHERSIRSRTKSPYETAIKQSNYHKSPKREKRSQSKESTKTKQSTSFNHNKYSSKDRRYSDEESVNGYQHKAVDYYKKSSKHKHKRDKKKKHNRDRS